MSWFLILYLSWRFNFFVFIFYFFNLFFALYRDCCSLCASLQYLLLPIHRKCNPFWLTPWTLPLFVVAVSVVPLFLSSVSRLLWVMVAAFMFFHSCMKIGCLAMAVLIVGCIVFSPAQVTGFDLPSQGTRAYENVLQDGFVSWYWKLLRFWRILPWEWCCHLLFGCMLQPSYS